MKLSLKNSIAPSLIALLLISVAGCASAPKPQVKQQGHSSDTQRSHAKQAQDELSRETAK